MNFSTADFSLNDRKKLMLAHFENFHGTETEFTLDDLYDFLDNKMGKPFDRSIGFQISEIVKGENDKMNLSDFINQYLDTEDTLNFRIDLDKKRIEEVIGKKMALFEEKKTMRSEFEQKGDFLKLYSVVKLMVKGASNLEGKSFNGEVNPYLKIVAGSNVFNTVRLTDEKNPEFNQEFDLVLKEDFQEIRLIVYDALRPGEEEVLGFARLSVDEVQEKGASEKSDYLVREDGLRTRSKVVFAYKLVPSALNEIDEKLQKFDGEIEEIEQVMKQNQRVLFLLREPFSTTLQPFPNAKAGVQNQRLGSGFNTEETETNDEGDEGVKITVFEETLKVKFEQAARKIGGDWSKIMLVSTAFFLAILLCVSYLRSMFFDTVVIGLVLMKGRLEFDKINFLFMRIVMILFSFSVAMDLIWLIFYTDNWLDSYETNMDDMKTFVIVFSYILFFFKFYYGMLLWRYALNLGDLKAMLKNYGFNSSV